MIIIKACILLFVLLPALAAGQVELTEIMFNPSEGGEWIEFYTGQEINLTQFMIKDNYQADTIACCTENCSMVVPAMSLFLIATQGTFNQSNAYCVDDSSIGNGLGNSHDTILLLDQDTALVNFSYNTSVKEGNSLSLVNGEWKEIRPTPLAANFVTPFEVAINYMEPLYTQVDYDDLFRIKNYGEPANISFYFNVSDSSGLVHEQTRQFYVNSYVSSGTTNVTFVNGGLYLLCGTASTTDYSAGLCANISVIDSNALVCNISIGTETEKQIYYEGEKIEFFHRLNNNSYPFSIKYWIENIYGEVVKKEVETTNTNKKTYTAKEDIVLIIKSELSVACNNTNNQTLSEKIVAVKPDREEDSKLTIVALPGQAVFGEAIKADINIYKGNTSARAVKVYIEGGERASPTYSFSFDNKYTDYALSMPIEIKDNCEEEYKSGKYYLVIEGLDRRVKSPIKLLDQDCAVVETNITKKEEYSLLSKNQDNSTVFLRIKLENNDKAGHTYSVWSYIYKGSKSYSGEREENKQNVTVSPSGAMDIDMKNILRDFDEGNYSVKIKILRDDRKTPYEITEPIFLVELINQKENIDLDVTNVSVNVLPETASEPNISLLTGNVVYESSSQKIKNNLIYVIIVAIILTIIAWYKTR